MEVIRSSETLVPVWTTLRNIPEDGGTFLKMSLILVNKDNSVLRPEELINCACMQNWRLMTVKGTISSTIKSILGCHAGCDNPVF
jgi:hypothetical protein